MPLLRLPPLHASEAAQALCGGFRAHPPAARSVGAQRTGAAGATPHIFRHTYMTSAQRAQIPVKTLQAIGGYADLATLQDRYVHTQREDIEAARGAIDGMFCDAAVTASKPANP